MPGPPTPLRKLSPQTPKPYAISGFVHWGIAAHIQATAAQRFRATTTTHLMLPIRNTKPFGTENHMADMPVAGFAKIQILSKGRLNSGESIYECYFLRVFQPNSSG